MTKLNNEVIVAIAGAYEKIGQAHLEIAEYLKTLAKGFPSIDEVLDNKEVTKEEASVEPQEEEDVNEVGEDVVEEDESDEEDESVDEEEVAEEEERPTIITIETEDGEEEIDLEEMTLKELKQFAEDYGLEVTSKTKKGIIEEILDQLYDEEEDEDDVEEVEDDVDGDVEDSEDDDEEDLAEMYGLNELSLEELAEICAEYGLSTKGKRQALIDRIVRGIKDGTIVVDDEDEEEGE